MLCVQVFHRMHMVFGILFLLFALMHDIKLWTYTVPGGIHGLTSFARFLICSMRICHNAVSTTCTDASL